MYKTGKPLWGILILCMMVAGLGCKAFAPATPVPVGPTEPLPISLEPTATHSAAQPEPSATDQPTAAFTATALPTNTPQPASEPFSLVRLAPAQGKLQDLLKEHAQKALALGLKPFVEFDATWCVNCQELAETLDDPLMIDAFTGTYIIRLDVDEWQNELGPAGFEMRGVPVFFKLDDQGRPTGDTVDGGAWDENTPANMAPILKAFFKR